MSLKPPQSPNTILDFRHVFDEGVSLAQRDGINFTGSSVTVTDNSAANRLDVTITGGGGAAYNVKDYGAVGDGSTDDTAAIQSAITACSAAGGGTVFAPGGTYKVTSALSIPNFVGIEGDGQSTNFRASGNVFIFNFNPANRVRLANFQVSAASVQASGGAFDFTNAAVNIWISDIWVGNNLYNTFNIRPSAAGKGQYFIRRIRFNGVASHNTPFLIGDGTNLLTDVHISDVLGNGSTNADVAGYIMDVGKNVDTLWVTDFGWVKSTQGIRLGNTGASGAVTDPKFTNVMVDQSTNKGFDIVACRGGSFVSLQCNTCGEPSIDVRALCIGVQIIGGTVQNGTGNGIIIRAGAIHTTISGVNVSDNNTANGTADGISIAANTTDFKVIGCTIGNNILLATGHQKYGIRIPAGTTDNYQIVGNRFSGNDTAPIVTQATGTTAFIAHNDPAPPTLVVASATTFTPPAGLPLVSVSGTTNITTITVLPAGTILTLVFQGSLTVTDGGTQRLSGDFNATSDDTITLASDGTNWYEIARSAN